MNSKESVTKAAQFVKALFVRDPFLNTDVVSDHSKSYKIVDKIGEGGMGAVYRARDPEEREVAVKIASSDRGIKRFKLETAVLKLLGQHPNIPGLIDWGLEISEIKFCVMEYVKGESLDKIIKNQTTWFYQDIIFYTLEIATQLLTALQHVHNKKIIHRDVKPQNIIVMKNEERLTLKLMDFGVCKALEKGFLSFLHRTLSFDEKALTLPGEPIGTLGYAPREQLDNSNPGESVDIFACGITIYEILYGGFLFRSTTLSKYLEELATFEYKPIELDPNETGCSQHILDMLNNILQKSLALNPKCRYSRASKMLKEILGVKKELDKCREILFHANH